MLTVSQTRVSISLAHGLALILCNNAHRARWHRERMADWWGGHQETPEDRVTRRLYQWG